MKNCQKYLGSSLFLTVPTYILHICTHYKYINTILLLHIKETSTIPLLIFSPSPSSSFPPSLLPPSIYLLPLPLYVYTYLYLTLSPSLSLSPSIFLPSLPSPSIVRSIFFSLFPCNVLYHDVHDNTHVKGTVARNFLPLVFFMN
jgi:hypothetical protein